MATTGNKYRVQDIAKDMGVDRSEIIELLDKAFGGTTKKAQTALSAEEVSYILASYSAKHEVKDFNEYYQKTGAIKTEKPKAEEKKPAAKKKAAAKTEQPVKEEKPVEKPAEKAEPKAEKPAEEPKAEKKPAVKAEEKAEEKKPVETAKPEEKPAAKAEPKAEKPAVKPAEDKKPQQTERPERRPDNRDNRQGGFNRDSRDNRDNRDNRQGSFNRDNRDNRQGGFNKDNRGEKRFDNRDNRNDRNRQSAPAQQPAAKPAHNAPAIDSSKIKVNTPPMQKQKGEAVQRGEQVTKMVDTRGSYVELDKYNERYESIAPASRHNNDNYQRKQKIQQKSQNKGKGGFNKRETEAQKLMRLELERARKQQLKVQIPDEIVVSELATRLKVTATEVIKKLFNLGVMANLNETIDFDTACIVAEELGAKVEKEVVVTIEERLFEEMEDSAEDLKPRSPVVVVMGHV
ncbi:MAG: translation initiation factor IF-2 N-terminal domain-containing protein, partial [Oscillospiraceae bacterium]|nr:translation initiation factor IF-2 N-terminal domain-containing protein [Oscillospiraceae bacterium]